MLVMSLGGYSVHVKNVQQTANVLDTLGISSGMATQSDMALLNGGCGSDPYQALARYGCTRQNECVPAGANGQGGINSGLACRLSKLFDAAAKAGCTPKIVSAYRSAAKQQAMCGSGGTGCLGAGKSCHQYGLAIDVGSCEGWLRQNAKNFELHFPYYGPHIQCIEHRVANCNPSTPPCKGGGPVASPGDSQNPNGQQSSPSPQGGQSGQGGDQQQGGGQSQPGGSGSSSNPDMSQQPPYPPTKPQTQVPIDTFDASMSLTCDPDHVSSGGSVTVSWECPSGSTAKGSSTDSGVTIKTQSKKKGEVTVSPKKNVTLTVQCMKAGQVLAEQSCDVAVQNEKVQTTVLLDVSQPEVYPGDIVDVTWSSKNARSCAVTGPGIASADKSGHMSSDPIEEDATFKITCKPKTGTDVVTKEETVTVIQTDPVKTQKKSRTTPSSTNTNQQTIFDDPLESI